LEKLQSWVNNLLEAERDEFLGRGRHQPLDEHHNNYRNGYRPRKINLFGLGEELRVPRDRKGEFESQGLPERKGQDPEREAFLAEAFLAGLSTRDLARISEKHLGKVRLQASIADCGAGHRGVGSLAAAVPEGPALQVCLPRWSQLSGWH
jgi:transposase-like protein